MKSVDYPNHFNFIGKSLISEFDDIEHHHYFTNSLIINAIIYHSNGIAKPCVMAYTVSFMFHHISFCACMTLQCILYFHLRQKPFKGIKSMQATSSRKTYICLKNIQFSFCAIYKYLYLEL